jgi:PKD repeat protein
VRRLLTSAIDGTHVFALTGVDGDFTVATFQSDPTLDFKAASIDWGDGSPATSGVIAHLGEANPRGDVGNISGEHTYDRAGSYTITVTAQESGSVGDGQTATVTSTARVVDDSINPGPVLSPTVAKGIAFDALTVANFTSPTPGASADDFSATIDWGDNTTPTTGTIVPAWSAVPVPVESPTGANGSGTATADGSPGGPTLTAFAVQGAHTYASSGSFTAQITISDGHGHSAQTTANLTVADSPLVVQPITEPFQAVVGAKYDSLPVAHFTDLGASPLPTNGNGNSTDGYSATIDWGDGTDPTAGDISPDFWIPEAMPDHPSFEVSGSHSYASAGTYTVTVTISDAAKDTATATRTVQVQTLSLTAQGQDVSVTTGAGNDPLTVATVKADPPSALTSADDFHVTIDWGDGTDPTDGQIFFAVLDPPGPADPTRTGSPASSPSFQGGLVGIVQGEHDYATAGTYTLHVTIVGPGGVSAEAASTATVTDAQIKAEGLSFDATTNVADTGQVVAAFTPASTSDTPDDYTAKIDWGDGSTSDGTVSDKWILPYAPTPGGGGGSDPAAGGGGTTAQPTIAFVDRFRITGDHTYTKAGSYTVQVTITGKDGATFTTKSTATVTDDTITADGRRVQLPVGGSDAQIEVAGFEDSAGLSTDAFTVSIDWGDGSDPTGGTVETRPVPVPVPMPSVTPGVGIAVANPSTSTSTSGAANLPVWVGSTYVVVGQHSYATAGEYTIQVTIKSSLGGAAKVTSRAIVGAASSDPNTTTPGDPTQTIDPGITQPVTTIKGPAGDSSSTSTPVTTPVGTGGTTTTDKGDPPNSGQPAGSGNVAESRGGGGAVVSLTPAQPKPTTIIGAAHPGKGAKKHHGGPKTHHKVAGYHAAGAVKAHASRVPGGNASH